MKLLVLLQSHRAKKHLNLASLASEVMEQLILAAVMSPSFKPHTVKAVCVARVSLPAASQIDA